LLNLPLSLKKLLLMAKKLARRDRVDIISNQQ